MVQLIMGLKGSGKTKKLVDCVLDAVKAENGDVVVVEKERKLTYDIPYQARLVDAADYPAGSYEFIKGLICGLHSGNYDISHIFIDNFYKLIDDKSEDSLLSFINWLDTFSNANNIDFVISISADEESVGDEIKKYLI